MASSGTGNPVISAALARMAVLRQAEVSEVTLDIFTAELATEGLVVDCVLDACDELAHRERSEGETAFPSYATLLRECHRAEYRRHQAQQRALAAEGERYLPPPSDHTPFFSREESKVLIGKFREAVEAKRQAIQSTTGAPVAPDRPKEALS